jgi:hypothetical protein
MDDDLILADLMEDEIRVARGGHTANRWIICPPANPWMDEQEIDHSLQMRLNPPGALWRLCSDVIQDRRKIGKGRACPAQPVACHCAAAPALPRGSATQYSTVRNVGRWPDTARVFMISRALLVSPY